MNNNELTKKLLDLGEKMSDNKTKADKVEAKLETLKERFKKKGLATTKAVSQRIDEIKKKIDDLDENIGKDFRQLEEKYNG